MCNSNLSPERGGKKISVVQVIPLLALLQERQLLIGAGLYDEVTITLNISDILTAYRSPQDLKEAMRYGT